jgi:hypothetical protein
LIKSASPEPQGWMAQNGSCCPSNA